MNTYISILLVEDDLDDQFLFTEAISEIENTSLYGIANNGNEALAKLEASAHLPDLIFTDINMPGMGGIECLTKIMRNPQTKDIPVVVLSSSVEQAGLAHLLGAKAFIEKTSNGKTLLLQLKQMISSGFMAHSHSSNPASQPMVCAF